MFHFSLMSEITLTFAINTEIVRYTLRSMAICLLSVWDNAFDRVNLSLSIMD